MTNASFKRFPPVIGAHITLPQTGCRRYYEGGIRLTAHALHRGDAPLHPLISIITVVRNGSSTIEQCLQSVAKQTYSHYEHIVIDGASTDDTITHIQQASHIAYFVSEKDEGIYHAMNKGLSLAQGSYILILNSDEYLEPRALETAVRYMSDQPGIIVLPTRKLRADGTSIGTFTLRFFDERVYLRMPCPHQSLIAASVYKEIGAYNLHYRLIADWDFFIRAYEHRVRVATVPATNHLVTYRRTGASAAHHGIAHPIHDEQIRMLASRFPDLRDDRLLRTLSSEMDETPASTLKDVLLSYVHAHGVLPPQIAAALRLYSSARFSHNDISALYSIIDKGEKHYLELRDIRHLITLGKRIGLRRSHGYLISDRGTDAADSGYELYKHICNNNALSASCSFVITRDSSDFTKCKALPGASLVEQNSRKHKLLYLFSDWVLSSHGGASAHPFSHRLVKKYHPEHAPKFGFLDHGISKDSIPYFFKGAFNHDAFVISGPMEHQLMTSHYRYPSSDLITSGLPRFDRYGGARANSQKIVAFLPTWRAHITTAAQLRRSGFLADIAALLRDKRLGSLLLAYGYTLRVYLHPNFAKYSSVLAQALARLHGSIKLHNGPIDYESVYRDAAVGITDYSSAVFDFAYLDKPVLYYHPDYADFRRRHYGETPFFDYVKHGLGPVCLTPEAVAQQLELLFKSKCVMPSFYKKRKGYIFSFSEGASCRNLLSSLDSITSRRLRCAEALVAASRTLPRSRGLITGIIDNELHLLLSARRSHLHTYLRPLDLTFVNQENEATTCKADLLGSGAILYFRGTLYYLLSFTLPDGIKRVHINKNPYAAAQLRCGRKRVLHFNALLRGGAANAVLRLDTGLNKYTDFSSEIVSLETSRGAPDLQNHHSLILLRSPEATKINTLIRSYYDKLKTNPGNILFSAACYKSAATVRQLKNLALAADILHLHWLPGMFTLEDIRDFLETGRHVLWTLHDTNVFTGGCHSTHGCDHWKQDCKPCPQLTDTLDNLPGLYLTAKKRYLGDLRNLTVVALNKHFAANLRQSPIFLRTRIEVIPNGLDTSVWRPLAKTVCCAKHGLNPNCKYVFYTSMYTSLIKGFQEFIAALHHLAKLNICRNITVITAGATPAHCHWPFPHRHFGTASQSAMVELYSLSDVTVMSSIEDNLPNVVVESLACGTPVAGFAVGGVPDLIMPGYNGFLAAVKDCEGLAHAIVKCLSGGQVLRDNCRRYAEKHLSLEVQAKQYEALYNDLLRTPVPPSTYEARKDIQRLLARARYTTLGKVLAHSRQSGG
jgi:glycosyltransferase involved in cell wall biosynthesis